MFDLGWPELLVIAIVLIVVVGPKDLPRMLRTFGRTTQKLRAMAGDFRKQFDEALAEAELDDVKTLVDDAKKLDPRNEIKKHLNPVEKVGQDIRSGLDAAMKPTPAKPAVPARTEVTEPPAAKTSDTAKAKPAAKPKATTGTKATRSAAAKAAPAKSTPAKAAAPRKAATKPKTAASKPAARKKTSGAQS